MSEPRGQDNIESLRDKIRRHEDNVKFLTSESYQLEGSLHSLQESLGNYHLVNEPGTKNENDSVEDETVEQILQQQNSAASIWCRLNSHNLTRTLNLPLTRDVLGIVATLASVNDDSLSRLLSEFLGTETMLAIVCKTHEGVKALEKYDEEGNINSSSGIHGVGFSIGKKISGRFFVICIEDLREYFGGFIVDDEQKKLALLKPKLPNGECPNGFVDYAVNMIKLHSNYLSGLTINGHGLRETLFFSLFSQLQVYSTRAEMLLALPCITDGAISLDGGMIKKSNIFALGDRKDVGVKFRVVSGETDVPADYSKTKEKIRMLKWERENVAKDIRREQELLELAKQKLKH